VVEQLRKRIQQPGRIIAALGAVASLALVPLAEAQCVLCYLSASSTGERGSSVLRAGILVLLIPTVVIFGALMLLLLRRREPAGIESADMGNAEGPGQPPVQ
jgi:hypothetical protein